MLLLVAEGFLAPSTHHYKSLSVFSLRMISIMVSESILKRVFNILPISTNTSQGDECVFLVFALEVETKTDFAVFYDTTMNKS